MQFEQTGRRYADHAFLAPVRAYSDEMMLLPWLGNGILDLELVDDVLAVDMRQPLASPLRCGLLATVPERWSANWQSVWINRLRDMAAAGPYVCLLAQRRAEIASNAISQNPLGQILEPEFRVIFPLPEAPQRGWALDALCRVQPTREGAPLPPRVFGY